MSNPKPERSSGLVLPDGTIAEALYDPTSGVSAFAVRRADGSIETVASLKLKDRELVPNIDSLVASGCVLLPSEVGHFESVEALAREVRAFIHKYVDMPDEWTEITAYYVLFSWVYEASTALPYLRFLGSTDTGKSRGLRTVGSLCYRPIFAGGAVTPAPIFRAIERHHGTLILDEADFRQSDAKAEVIKILNMGYQSGFPVLRTEGDNYEVRAYRVFGPKIIATRFRFQDPALENRCLTVRMGQTRRRDLPLNLPTSFDEDARLLRNKLLTYRLKTLLTLRLPPTYLTHGLEPRLAQVLGPLMAIMPEHETLLTLARQLQEDVTTEQGDSLEAHVAVTLLGAYSKGQEPPSVSSVCDGVRKMLITESAPQREFGQVTPKKIGSIIREFGLKTVRGPTGNRAYVIKHWRQDAIDAMVARFGLDAQEAEA